MRKVFFALSAALIIIGNSMPSYGAWSQQGSQWIYEENELHAKEVWKFIDGAWYYFDQTGYMVTGWKLINSKWYFLNPISDGTKGKMLTGWQWINGKCYFLSPIASEICPEGSMYENGLTPDGYYVDASGAWTQNGRIIEVPGKGIQTEAAKKSKTTFSGKGGGSGGSGGGSRRNNDKNKLPKDKNPGETEIPVLPIKQYKYTIRYMDIADKSTLQIMTGTGNEGETVQLSQPHIDGYKICKGQKETFMLVTDKITLTIYYEKETPTTPSEAKKVEWDLKFIEEGKPGKEILKGQKGKTEEGKELSINFPETIIGTDQYYYHSLVPSPWSVEVNGNGIQKYYIKFRKGERVAEVADPDAQAKEKLNHWLEVAREADLTITGEVPMDFQLITSTLEESRERLLNLVSMAEGTDRKEVYLIAKGHTPSAVAVAQNFREAKNISEMPMEQLVLGTETYLVLRVGFEKTYDKESEYEEIERLDPTCTEYGHVILQYKKTGKEETIILPPTGHQDIDGDGLCDICHEAANELPELIHYSVGDVQARRIGNQTYLFRCIDSDYEDVKGNSQKLALFLADSVIRTDTEGISKKMIFGTNNNYKQSNVRKWLLNMAGHEFLHKTYIGITKTYLGSTAPGTYEQFNESDLTGQDSGYQQLEDPVFILSVDEAIQYRDYLWKFNGSDENNPRSQVSAYSKGYYLRSPQTNGEGIYAVSLVDGNIQPVEVSDTSIGIRPVMTLPQG